MDNKQSWFVLGNGIELLSRQIIFFPNLRIDQITSELTVFDLAAAGSEGFREWAMLEPISRSCQFEIVSIDNDIPSGYDTLNRAWLLNTLLVLRMKLKSNCVACSSYSWNKIAGSSKERSTLEPFKGNLLDFHTRIIQLPKFEKKQIEESDVEWIQKYFDSANSLAAQSDNFRFALETINSWRYSNDVKSAIAIIWAAIESIVGISSEIVFRLSLNIASLLEARGESRLQKFKHVKKLYGLRSKVVHGSNLNPEQIEFAIEESFFLLRDLVVYMIEKNKIITEDDFESAVFY